MTNDSSENSTISRAKSRIRLAIGVRELAQPLKQIGSIGSSELDSASFMASSLGQAIHQQVQSRIAIENLGYTSEVHFKQNHEVENLSLEISGRCDGMYDLGDHSMLEEIKTTTRLDSLRQDIEDRYDHPYRLQILTYGFIYYNSNQKEVSLRLRLICRKTLEEICLQVEFDLKAYRTWLEKRCLQIIESYKRLKQLKASRRRLSKLVSFPFDHPRPQQDKLMEVVSNSINNGRNLMLQAPTGLGKTAGVLLPALKQSLAKGAPVVFITPKNSQFKAAIDLVRVLHKHKVRLKVLVLNAKQKSCINEELSCHKTTCQYAENYFEKRESNSLDLRDKRRDFWGSGYFRDLAESAFVCPYELSMDRIPQADLIIADYNYVFSMRSNFIDRYRHEYLPVIKPTLIIDEAHNLYKRVLENYSPFIKVSTIDSLIVRLETDEDELDALEICLRTKAFVTNLILGSRIPGNKSFEVAPNIEQLYQIREDIWHATLDRFFAERPVGLNHPLAELHQIVGDFLDVYDTAGAGDSGSCKCLAIQKDDGWQLKLVSCDASQFIKSELGFFRAVVAFSATLKPFDFYATVSGFVGNKLEIAEFVSPFPRENKKIIIIPQIQTSYRKRALHIHRIQEIIKRVIKLKKGHYLVFFPSYRFLEQVASSMPDLSEWRLVKQTPSMTMSQVNELIENIRPEASPCLLFAVQGGSLSEGIDLKGRGLNGVFIVGPALPNFDPERELIKSYYQERFKSGDEYAYIFPAMAKSIQAAGRVVRGQEEKAIIILLDERFMNQSYYQSYPKDWYQKTPNELLSRSIIRDIESFWIEHNRCES